MSYMYLHSGSTGMSGQEMLAHVPFPLSGIDEMALLVGLRAADYLLCGCVPVYTIAGAGFKGLWGYVTVTGDP